MKLSKKILAAFSAAALLATAAVFTSCGDEDDDDENKMFSGSNNNYTLSYDNTEGTDASRGYKVTSANHRGALCNITLDVENTTAGGATLGYIWDLESNSVDAEAGTVARKISDKPRNFCIVGFNYGYPASGKVNYYVSRYTDVYDIMADNFGEKSGVEVNGEVVKAKETEYIKFNSSNAKEPSHKDENGNILVTVAVYEGGSLADGKKFSYDTDGHNYATYDGSYVVELFDGKYSSEELDNMSDEERKAIRLDSATISASDLGYTPADGADTTKHVVKELQGAVYANVLAGNKAQATFHYDETYSADEVVED